MKKIVVLVDMTESAKPALLQARVLAENAGADLVALYIANDDGSDESHINVLEWFVRKTIGDTLPLQTVVGKGNYLQIIPGLVEQLNPDLVIFCTHGIKGLAQHLFGAHVLKLVNAIKVPCLVVQENTEVRVDGFKRILIPASPFADYMYKVEAAADVAKIFGSEMIHYEIDKYLGNSEDDIAANRQKAESFLTDHGLKLEAVIEDSTTLSLGYAQQTMKFAKENDIDLLALSSETHHEEMAMGKPDKELFLTNEFGIPVLCSGH